MSCMGDVVGSIVWKTVSISVGNDVGFIVGDSDGLFVYIIGIFVDINVTYVGENVDGIFVGINVRDVGYNVGSYVVTAESVIDCDSDDENC